MAASLLLWRGRSGALKTLLLEARVFRGLASTVSLSAASGKSEKGLPPNSKRQSPSTDVVEPKERGKLLASPAAAELSKNLSSPSSYPSVVNPGGRGASPRPSPEDSVLLTDEGLPEFLSRKTLVEFPQKVLPPLREQGSDSKALQENRGGTDHSSSSFSDSSSSSSSSSDSESDEEAGGSKVGPPVMSKGRGGLPKPQASRSLENRAPKIATSAKEKTGSQQGQPDLSAPERPQQVKKKGPVRPPEGRKGARPETTAPKVQADKEFMKKRVKEKQVLEREGERAFPPIDKEGSGKRVTGGVLKAQGDVLEDQVQPVQHLKPAGLVLEGKDAMAEESAPGPAERDDTQEPAQAASPAEPFDNTTYRNLQHHDYTPYTFLDLNLDLSKFRMPQPSSGRQSPRH